MPTENREYTTVPANVSPDVPHWVNLALGQIDADLHGVDRRTEALEDTRVPNALRDAKAYTDAETGKALRDAKAYTDAETGKDRSRLAALEDTRVPNALRDAKSYTDAETGKDRSRLAALEDTRVPNALRDAKSYTDAEAGKAVRDAKSYTDAETGKAVRDAKSYTDAEVVKDRERIEATAEIIRAGDGDSGGVLATVTDAGGLMTDLTVRSQDGQIPDWVLERQGKRHGISTVSNDADVLAGFVDADGVHTDLMVRASDGQVPDLTIQRWGTRLKSRDGSGVYERDGSLFMVQASPDLAAWGSSTLSHMATACAARAKSRQSAYFDAAFGGLWAEHISARLGSVPALLTFPGNAIPAAGEALVGVSNFPDQRVNFPHLDGTVAGVRGRLSGGVTNGYKFTRTGTGAAVEVAPGVPFIPDIGIAHRGDTTILNTGKNNLNNSQPGAVRKVLEATARDIAYLSPLVKKVLVLGHFVNSGTPDDSAQRSAVMEVNEGYARAYAPVYVDVQSFVTGPLIWDYSGMEPTSEDAAEQARGNKPPSLSLDPSHLNAAGSAALARYTFEKLNSLGWY